MKELIIKILGNKFTQNINKNTFMLNNDGEIINLSKDDYTIYQDDSFKLYSYDGEILLSTTTSNQLINDEWITKLNDLTQIQFAIRKLI